MAPGNLGGRCTSSPHPAHRRSGDPAHLVFDRPASACAVRHRPLVGSRQERRRLRPGRQPLPAPDRRQVVPVLACPVDVYPAGDAVPLTVRRLPTALWTPQSSSPISIAFTGPVSLAPLASDSSQHDSSHEDRHRSAIIDIAIPMVFQPRAAVMPSPRWIPGRDNGPRIPHFPTARSCGASRQGADSRLQRRGSRGVQHASIRSRTAASAPFGVSTAID